MIEWSNNNNNCSIVCDVCRIRKGPYVSRLTDRQTMRIAIIAAYASGMRFLKRKVKIYAKFNTNYTENQCWFCEYCQEQYYDTIVWPKNTTESNNASKQIKHP
jgi:hypothetical protein